MAPAKMGLDYFPHDVGMTKDRKLRAVRKMYGSAAIDVWLALLDMIYADKGYYLEYNEKTKDDIIWDIMDYTKGKYAPTPDDVANIVESLVACELFSGDQFKLGILTSRRIQSIFYSATVERKNVEVDTDIWLLSISEMKKLSARHSLIFFFDNRPICKDNRPICEDNLPISPQSKVKQSKVKQSKVEESKYVLTTEDRASLVTDYGESAVRLYEKKFQNWYTNNNVPKADPYRTICKMLITDGIPHAEKSNSSFSVAELELLATKKYE